MNIEEASNEGSTQSELVRCENGAGEPRGSSHRAEAAQPFAEQCIRNRPWLTATVPIPWQAHSFPNAYNSRAACLGFRAARTEASRARWLRAAAAGARPLSVHVRNAAACSLSRVARPEFDVDRPQGQGGAAECPGLGSARAGGGVHGHEIQPKSALARQTMCARPKGRIWSAFGVPLGCLWGAPDAGSGQEIRVRRIQPVCHRVGHLGELPGAQ